jgi:hypothetical protein
MKITGLVVCMWYRKHAPYDEYDQWLLGPEGPWREGGTGPRPDVLVVQIGHSTCLPSFDTVKSQTELQHGDETFNAHAAQVDVLLDAIKAAIARTSAATADSSTAPGNTTVIVSTAPRSGMGNSKADICTWKLNRIIARAAHNRGFIVLEREEIEHRLTFKLESSEDLIERGAVDTAEAPAAQVVSTALLSMLRCLASNETHPPSV